MMASRPRYDSKLDDILSAAAVLFADRGFDRTSIRDLAAETEVSLSGLYYYFSSKDELLYLIQRRAFETLLDELDRTLADAATPEDAFAVLVRTHLRFFLDHMPEMKVISHEGDHLPPDYLEEIRGLKRTYADRVARLIRGVRPDLPVSERVITFALFGQLNWIYTWYRPGRDPGLDELAPIMEGMLLHGILGVPAVGTPGESGTPGGIKNG